MTRGCSLVVLAGGRSRRMGRDKSMLPAGDQSLIERIITRLAPVVDDITIAGRLTHAHLQGVRTVEDEYPDAGPLAGIHAGLLAVGAPYAWVVGCDLPDVEPALGPLMLKAATGFDAVVPRIAAEPQGVCALYDVRLAQLIESRLDSGLRSVAGLFDACSVRYLDEADLRSVDPGLTSFRNLNTPADYDGWIRSQALR
ncbi:MAG: molybdenum cofactor guanylyltransferase [Candidatus Dormibacteria bacterium]